VNREQRAACEIILRLDLVPRLPFDSCQKERRNAAGVVLHGRDAGIVL
jgi:hypothetical protein